MHTEPQICPCGNITHLNKKNNKYGYTTYCSDKCSKLYRTNNKSYNKIMSDYDWLYNNRIILKKSKDQIAEELNCSYTVVNKWLKFHNIPNIKYNESNAIIKEKINNKDLLYDLHVNNKKTCTEIAIELGSSKSTISIALNNHSIPINNCNDYPRKINKTSIECTEVINYIKSVYDDDIQTEVHGILKNGLSLDILIPKYKLAIEYNGLYSHIYRPYNNTFATIKGRDYHITKTNLCENNDIQLLHIFSSSWKNKTDIWKSIILHKLHKTENKIYARNCTIKEIDTYTKQIFLDNNHLQGKDKSNIKLGLYYNNELVSVMTFIKSRYNNKYDWELSRYANKTYTNVIGGFSKLLKYFRSNNSGSIISYADRTYSNGLVYKNNGFEQLWINTPGYYYVNNRYDNLINRRSLQKKELLKYYNNPVLTEYELAIKLGYNKIYDCGTIAFGLK